MEQSAAYMSFSCHGDGSSDMKKSCHGDGSSDMKKCQKNRPYDTLLNYKPAGEHSFSAG